MALQKLKSGIKAGQLTHLRARVSGI